MSQYDVYNQFRNELLGIAQDQLEITRDLKLDKIQTEGQKVGKTLENLICRLNSSQFLVLLVGVFNAGKTTFINALIGEKLLPSAQVPTTAVLCRIIYGEANKKKITLYPKSGPNAPNGGQPFDITIEQLNEYITIDHDNPVGEVESPYDRMEMYWPLPLCQNGVELVDSVGLDDPASRDRITLDYLQKADAVLYLMPCYHICAGKDMAAIQEIRTMGFNSPFFILTHADDLEGEDDGGASVRAYAKRHLADKTELGENGLLYVNSRGAIAAKTASNQEEIEKSGILKIESALEGFLVREKGRSKIFTNLFSLQEQNRLVADAIRFRDGMLRQDVEELEEKLKNIQEPLQNLKNQKNNLLEWTRTAIDSITIDIYTVAEAYFSELPRKVEEWGNEYQIRNSAGIIPRKSTIEPIVQEVADHLRMKIEEDIAWWSEKTLSPLISQKIEKIASRINESGSNFEANIDNLREHIMPEVSPDADSISEQTQPKLWERLVSSAAAFTGAGFIAGAVGGVHGIKALVGNIVTQVVAGIVGFYVLGLALGPGAIVVIVAAILHAFLVGSNVGNTIKQKTCKKMVEGMEQTRHQSVKKLQDQIQGNLMKEIYMSLNDVMEGDINSLENEVTAQIEDRKKASFDIKTERQTLETACTKNAALQQRLTRIAEQVVTFRWRETP